MDLAHLPAGAQPPRDLNVVIEIPQGSQVTYRLDPASGAILVDRVLFTPLAYPAAYGFVPATLTPEGSRLEAMVLVPAPVVPGCVIRARPVGLLHTRHAAGADTKLVCVPHDSVHPMYSKVGTAQDLPGITRGAIEHFFASLGDGDSSEPATVKGWGTADQAAALIEEAVTAYRLDQADATPRTRPALAAD